MLKNKRKELETTEILQVVIIAVLFIILNLLFIILFIILKIKFKNIPNACLNYINI